MALLLALLALPSAVFAHRDDQYLQATLVAIEPSGVRLQINLTPGVAVAEQVLAQIDRDRDGAISKNEAAAYAELLKRDLTLRVDGRKLELKLTASEFVPPAELRTGSGTIQMEFSAISGPLAAGRPQAHAREPAFNPDECVSHQRRAAQVCHGPDHPAETQRRTRAWAKSNLPFIRLAQRLLCPLDSRHTVEKRYPG